MLTDAIDMLAADHVRIQSLFSECDSSESDNKRRVIFEDIRTELDIHSYVEETIFYPAFRKHPELTSMIDQSYDEHREVKQLIERISSLYAERTGGNSHARELVSTLRQKVEAHAAKEEAELFPAVKRHMKRNEREQLGRHISVARQEKEEAAA